ncbi:MAG: hypothetical protein FWD40_09075 [Treponema sp.]|nr:hypothetical protein [Treponema sp.]
MHQTINELYLGYLAGNIDRADFEGSVYIHLMNNKEKTCLAHWKNDEYEDFISWFYPRLRKSIDSYRETGASFEAFMNKYLLISSREYQTRTATNAMTEYSAWSARIPEMYAREEPPVYAHKQAEDFLSLLIIDKMGKRNSKRILALVLKCYYYVSADFAERIAPKIGLKSGELLEMLDKIRKTREKKDDKIYRLKERIYCQYYRCIIYDKRLSVIKENSSAYNKLKLRRDKAKIRLEKMRNRMMNIRTEATNKQVADVIGIKKGTVDSSLHQLKLKWEEMAKKADLN